MAGRVCGLLPSALRVNSEAGSAGKTAKAARRGGEGRQGARRSFDRSSQQRTLPPFRQIQKLCFLLATFRVTLERHPGFSAKSI